MNPQERRGANIRAALEGEQPTPHRLICAWCQAVMAEGRLPPSHGCCPNCLHRMEAEMDLEDRLWNLPNSSR